MNTEQEPESKSLTTQETAAKLQRILVADSANTTIQVDIVTYDMRMQNALARSEERSIDRTPEKRLELWKVFAGAGASVWSRSSLARRITD